MSARDLIFHMNIPCDKTFPWVPLFFFPVTLNLVFDPYYNLATCNNFWTLSDRLLVINLLTLTFDHFLKIDIGLNFWKINIRALNILHISIFCDKIFLLVSRYLSLWPWPAVELAIIVGICVSQTHPLKTLHSNDNNCYEIRYPSWLLRLVGLSKWN